MHRGALNLLSSYGGDSSDEEVPRGRVSTKRCLKDEEEVSLKKIQARLPVPQVFCKADGIVEHTSIDDPSHHGGRIRSFPHERGNWVTYVYIPYEPTDTLLSDIITRIINTLPYLNMQAINDFHISLTKTIILKHHWINSFIESIRIKTQMIKKFIIMFNTLNVYCNEERTRTFIGLDIKSGYDTLCKLVEHLDSCMDEFNLPHFYENPSFHMSLVWCVGDYENEISKILPQLCMGTEEVLNNYPQSSWYNYVTHLECKSGNKLFNLKLT
ncbi:hypothetical protein ILUMI_07302 [Ignelater luminosus]|uniref:U6 snRNA phosphodiesterase n=1 Tax=Ignelater luminosus TaxID=2038154 RepID=A0A8K0GGG3_IGNLU|nr:hypothetical protein ILUMI_07302 [Ignelater luminosus]